MADQMSDLYQKALEADEAFSYAIVVQFGENATRWTRSFREFNDATKKAYDNKIEADRQWLNYLRNNQTEEGAKI